MNAKEQAVTDLLRAEGWEVYNSGWPDLLVTRVVNGKREVAAIEVKGNRFDRPRENQQDVLEILNEIMPVGVAHCEPEGHIDFRTAKGVLAGSVKEGRWNG